MIHLHTFLSAALALSVLGLVHDAHAAAMPAATDPATIALPQPDLAGKVTLEHALATRRSVREYATTALTLAEAGQIAWAAQGVTSPDGKRTAPSARAIYPLTVYLVANDVTGLAAGVYRYVPKTHALALVAAGDHSTALVAVTPHEPFVGRAPLVVVVAGDSALAAQKFGAGAERWSAMETGFVVQDVYLQATTLGLATLMVGSFDDALLRAAIALPAGQVLYAEMPVGHGK